MEKKKGQNCSVALNAGGQDCSVGDGGRWKEARLRRRSRKRQAAAHIDMGKAQQQMNRQARGRARGEDQPGKGEQGFAGEQPHKGHRVVHTAKARPAAPAQRCQLSTRALGLLSDRCQLSRRAARLTPQRPPHCCQSTTRLRPLASPACVESEVVKGRSGKWGECAAVSECSRAFPACVRSAVASVVCVGGNNGARVHGCERASGPSGC